MNEPDADLTRELASLATRSRQRNRARTDQLLALVERVGLTDEVRAELHQLAHAIKGAAGMFDDPEVESRAAALEQACLDAGAAEVRALVRRVDEAVSATSRTPS